MTPDKQLTVEQLIRILKSLPDNWKVEANSVRNLTVFDDTGKYVGFIDFLFDGSYEKVGE